MALKKLFTYAVIYGGKEATDKTPEDPAKIIIEPTNILAKDVKEVQTRVSRAFPEEYIDKLDLIEIAIRPF